MQNTRTHTRTKEKTKGKGAPVSSLSARCASSSYAPPRAARFGVRAPLTSELPVPAVSLSRHVIWCPRHSLAPLAGRVGQRGALFGVPAGPDARLCPDDSRPTQLFLATCCLDPSRIWPYGCATGTRFCFKLKQRCLLTPLLQACFRATVQRTSALFEDQQTTGTVGVE